ncbi:ArgP/LysG family DNA-binding transcriptional regulator [Nocardioides zeae]|uniref:ArgP/LysG family DNA-binding transcriptional regulator n=1 Tax=Nocardioides imazamoxiresistens TaxID=3231893 RepID=A0ABU3PVX0_9ACTN|nr:ArgP/LysG family DNA-binding transcriptional regulator [Nocardioides zeae]MDT9593344.1 ArgP/LysG family DNA-binding transcriptional regulator [Nocardioides zeae]
MYQPAHLAALVAVVDHGTFDRAATALHVTPSAVSQRIRALETQVGQVLVTRAAPCRATPAGDVLVGLGRQTALLADEAVLRLGGPAGVRRAAVAVNADTLATWFHDVLDVVAGWDEVALEIHVEDQGRSTRLLREGRVLGAVTSDDQPVQGCTVQRLGGLRYHPVATRSLLERHGGVAAPDFERLPLVRFNEVDALQHDWLAGRAGPEVVPRVVHRVPTTADMGEAVVRGLGWGMLLDTQLEAVTERVRAGELVALAPGRPLVVPLFWQRWRLRSELLDRLGDAVLAAAPGDP